MKRDVRLFPSKKKLLKRSEQKKRYCPFDGIWYVLLQRANSAREHLIESKRTRLRGQWRKSPTLAQCNIWGKLSFTALAAEVAPLECLIAGY